MARVIDIVQAQEPDVLGPMCTQCGVNGDTRHAAHHTLALPVHPKRIPSYGLQRHSGAHASMLCSNRANVGVARDGVPKCCSGG